MRWLSRVVASLLLIDEAFAGECWPECSKPPQMDVEQIFASVAVVVDKEATFIDRGSLDESLAKIEKEQALFGHTKFIKNITSDCVPETITSVDDITKIINCKNLEWATTEEEKEWRPRRMARFLLVASEQMPKNITVEEGKSVMKELMQNDLTLIIFTKGSTKAAAGWRDLLLNVSSGNRALLVSIDSKKINSKEFEVTLSRILARWAGMDYTFTGSTSVRKDLNIFMEVPPTNSSNYKGVYPQTVFQNTLSYFFEVEQKLANSTKASVDYKFAAFGNDYSVCVKLDSETYSDYAAFNSSMAKAAAKVALKKGIDYSLLDNAIYEAVQASNNNTINVIYATHMPSQEKAVTDEKYKCGSGAPLALKEACALAAKSKIRLAILGSKEVVENADLIKSCPNAIIAKAETTDPASMAFILGEAISHLVPSKMRICGRPKAIDWPTRTTTTPEPKTTTEITTTQATAGPPPGPPTVHPAPNPTRPQKQGKKNGVIIGAAAGCAGLLMVGVAALRMRQRSQNILGDEQYDEEFGNANPDISAREADDHDFVIQSDELFQG